MSKIIKYATINGLSTALYVIAVASFMFFLGNSFPDEEKNIFIPIAMLMLFVFSAALTGTLVFGRPIMWYLNNKKQEAIKLLLYTLITILIITAIAFLLLSITI